MYDTLPLVNRSGNSHIAILTEPLACFEQASGIVNIERFISHVNALAAALSDGKYVINLCGNRYLFLVSFCAVILRKQTNLLPPNKNIATQEKLYQNYDGCHIIHDGIEVDPNIPALDLSSKKVSAVKALHETPQINMNHLAAISFTSGSTGDSKPNLKYWHTLFTSSNINYLHMVPKTDQTLYQLATVPAQHMWGLETSALLPLFHNICTSDAKPLYTQDIIDVLQALPKPRMLVSTPVHLRALATTSVENLSLFLVLCATSPLSCTLAKKIESLFSTTLREVYGCSEVGSMAVRETAKEEQWQRFTGIHFKQTHNGTTASAEHLHEEIELQDTLQLLDEQHFLFTGRKADMVDIAGKRGSLFELNQVLLKFPALNDGIIIFPESTKAIPRLCAIVSLKKGTEKSELYEYFRKHLDSAFVPRPIFIVDKLPREENGKLLKTNLNALYQSLIKR